MKTLMPDGIVRKTLDLGEFQAVRYAQLYSVFGDQTGRTYHITVNDFDPSMANPSPIEVVYNDTPTRLDPDDKDAVYRPFDRLQDVAAYIAQCEGIE